MECGFRGVLVRVVGLDSWEGGCERSDETGLVVDEEGGNGMGR